MVPDLCVRRHGQVGHRVNRSLESQSDIELYTAQTDGRSTFFLRIESTVTRHLGSDVITVFIRDGVVRTVHELQFVGLSGSKVLGVRRARFQQP
ncbi:hypothetical protein D3C81_1782090 [compost metagenome]